MTTADAVQETTADVTESTTPLEGNDGMYDTSNAGVTNKDLRGS